MASADVATAPHVDVDSAQWWEAVQRHEFLLPYCATCGSTFFPPEPTCPICGAVGPVLQKASTGGTIYSWIVVHHAFDPAFARELPYTILSVQLDAGARMFGRLIGDPPLFDSGSRVAVTFYGAEGHELVGFEIDPNESHGH